MNQSQKFLQERREALKSSIAPILSELEQIEAALTAMDRVRKDTRAHFASLHVPAGAGKSISYQILEVLGQGGPLPTAEIAERIRKQYGRAVDNKNVSWYLTKLKREEKAVLENGLWAAAQNAKDPEAEASEPSH